jgi:hypothetical protein
VLFEEFGMLPRGSEFSTTNTAARLLRLILEQRC